MPQRLLRNSTVKVSEALQLAIMELANIRKGLVTAEFILMALVEQKDSIVLKIFDELRVDTGALRRDISDRVLTSGQTLPELRPGTNVSIQISQDVQNLFTAADAERKRLGDAYISTHALFLACFDGAVPGTRRMLTDLGLSKETCDMALVSLRGSTKVDQKDSESRQSMLEEYTTDLTALARRGGLDPVICRENEIRRVIEILSRRKKNNPVLIGEPGVGKTVVVEGLAQAIVEAEAPDYLLNRRVLSLEMGSLIAGAKMQGEFEERLKKLVDEIIASDGEIILFIDELHTVVGTGRSGGGLDASNMLKPALAKGHLQCIGATTDREFKKYIESDKALERRFQPVRIGQPSVGDTIAILKGLKMRYETHHGIEYTEEALVAAAEFSDRYLTERFLPDKAIDLIDEAGASKRLKNVSTPSDVRILEASRQDLQAKKAHAFTSQDFELMAQHQMALSKVETELKALRDAHASTIHDSDKRVDTGDIARVVSRQTGIPVTKMVAAEADRMRALEEHLASRVVGQKHAIHSVANAIRRNRAGLRRGDRPVASFLFLGPTGVGKTELVKAIASELMDDQSKIVRLDMSEFMEKHSVAKLIGSPPGYVGYGEGGQLTERVRRQPYSVVLFDEFEKAHPDVYNILLQVLDEGWLTDGEGQRVSFRNCVIVGTSNIGSDILIDRKRPVGIGAQAESFDRDAESSAVMEEVKRFLRPEFINRLDEIIIFERLSRKDLGDILAFQLKDLTGRLLQQGVTLVVDPSLTNYLLDGMDNAPYGARPLRRKVEQLVENALANWMIAGGTAKTNTVKVAVQNGTVVVS